MYQNISLNECGGLYKIPTNDNFTIYIITKSQLKNFYDSKTYRKSLKSKDPIVDQSARINLVDAPIFPVQQQGKNNNGEVVQWAIDFKRLAFLAGICVVIIFFLLFSEEINPSMFAPSTAYDDDYNYDDGDDYDDIWEDEWLVHL